VQKTVCCTAPSAPYSRPTQRLSRPPPIQKLGAENHMLQLNIQCSWWWAYVPETCRAKNTSINYIVALSWHFTLFHEEDARPNNPQDSWLNEILNNNIEIERGWWRQRSKMTRKLEVMSYENQAAPAPDCTGTLHSTCNIHCIFRSPAGSDSRQYECPSHWHSPT